MHINTLEIQNIMRVRALTINADGKHVIIRGKNASGKSTAVNSLWMVLGGKSAPDFPEPITQGETSGMAKIDLGEYVAIKRWTPAGSVLKLQAADGSEIRRPSEIIEGLLGKYMLDPVGFLRRKPAEQVADILRIMGIDPPVDKVEEIAGERFEPGVDETADRYLQRLIGDRVGLLYIRRLEYNRTADEKKKAHGESLQELLKIGGPPTAEDLAADVTELHHTLRAAYGDQTKYQELESAVNTARSAVELAESEREQISSEIESRQNRVEQIKSEIARLQNEMHIKSNECQSLVRDGVTKDQQIGELRKVHLTAVETLDATTDPKAVIDDLNSKITKAQEQSEANAQRQQAANLCSRLQEEYQQANERAKASDKILSEVRVLAVGLLRGFDLGIPNLEVGIGELRLNGVSFSQASQAEKLRVAVGVVTRQNPTLKVIRIDDGEHLDEDSRKLVFEIADAGGWQVFMTIVAKGDLSVEVVEGEPEASPAVEQKSKSRKTKSRAA